jgi:hypothetical protein
MSSDDDGLTGKGDAIDLTEKEGVVETRRKKDASIDLTGMD